MKEEIRAALDMTPGFARVVHGEIVLMLSVVCTEHVQMLYLLAGDLVGVGATKAPAMIFWFWVSFRPLDIE